MFIQFIIQEAKLNWKILMYDNLKIIKKKIKVS